MAILSFLIILSVLVLVHELGHFLVAKKAGIKVEEFGFGYPPRVFGKKINNTLYSLNLLPFGGFVRMLGEDLESGPKSFAAKSKSSRALVLIAGVLMNFLLGVVLFAAVYAKTGIPEPAGYLTVTAVAPNSPAEAAGINLGDKIMDFKDSKTFIDRVNASRGFLFSFTIGDKNATKTIWVTPRLVEQTPAGEGALGVGFTDIKMVFYPWWQQPFKGMWLGLKEALGWGKEIVKGLGMMVSGLLAGETPKDVAGPVGIYQISKSATQAGWLQSFQFTGILSINLAILNLLPLPALDGGRLFFLGLEALFRRRLNPKLEQTIHLAGMLLLIGLMVLVTINDIKRLILLK